jgi:hypothetical protein
MLHASFAELSSPTALLDVFKKMDVPGWTSRTLRPHPIIVDVSNGERRSHKGRHTGISDWIHLRDPAYPMLGFGMLVCCGEWQFVEV